MKKKSSLNIKKENMSQRFSFIRFILREKGPNTKFFSGPCFLYSD